MATKTPYRTAAGRELSRAVSKEKLKTFGERVRFARIASNLSQDEFARAVSNAAQTKTTKSIVSQWENGHVKMPQHATMLAISACTLFALEWLTTGKGPERISMKAPNNGSAPGLAPLIHRAVCISAEVQKTPQAIADATLQVFEALRDDPNTPDSALKRIAQLATKTKK